jgi:hypothetical protein
VTTKDSLDCILVVKFDCHVSQILERAAVDHPHHTLWVILALANANKDQELANQGLSAKRRGKLATGKSPSSQDAEVSIQFSSIQ